MEHEPIHKKVGKNLLSIRKARSLSLDQVSELTGVSKAMLGQIERGDSNPTISVLWKIVNGLHISFTSLIEDDVSQATHVKFADVSPFIEENGQYRSYPMFPFDPGKQFELFTVEMDPGCIHPSEPHNKGVEEYLIVTRGRLKVTVQHDSYELQAGDALRFSADREHRYENLSDGITVYQALIYYPS